MHAHPPSADSSVMIRHFTVTALVLHEGAVLLVEHKKAQCFLGPGGHVEPNEDPVTALLRELREETGLEGEVIDEVRFSHPEVASLPQPFATVLVNMEARGAEPAHQHVDFIYAVKPLTFDIRLQDAELSGYRWVPLDEVAELPTPPEYPELIKGAAEYAAKLGAF